MSDSANDGAQWTAGDSSSRASLLLVESLIHALVAKSVLTHAEAVEIVDIAADVEGELAGQLDGMAPPHLKQTLLEPLARTFRQDLPD